MIVRKDRADTAKGRGGGLLIYVKNEISAWEVEKENEVCQVGGIGIKGKSGSNDIHLYLVYRSPNKSSAENDTKLNSWMATLKGRYVIFGDPNYPGINWEDNTSSEAKARNFIDVIDTNFMTQFVSGPTHIAGNTLDLVIGSDENIVTEVTKEGRLGASDHEMLSCTVEVDAQVQESKTEKRDYSKMNSEEMRKALDRDWEEELAGLDTEDTWQKLKEIVTKAMDECIPWKKIGGRRKPRWMNGKIERLIAKKKTLWARFKESKRQRDKEAYKAAEKELKTQVRKAKKNLEKKVADQSKEKPKQFYQYLKGQRANRVKVGPLKENGKLIVDAKEQATILNSQYASVFTVDDGAEIPELKPEVEEDKEMSTVNFTWEKVKKKLDGLNKDSAGGPDGIPPRILKEFSEELSKPLAMLYQRSMDETVIPQDWKDSEVVPLYKGGSKFEPPSYRPVNLTVACCRVMESLINEEVEKHLETNKLIRQTQHGFRRGHSCQTNLIEFWGKVLEWVDEGEPVDVKFYDFAKAFDKVEHRRLVAKVRAKGIKGRLLAWIAEWLRGRRQRVVVEGEKSEWKPVDSSVIQGSVLGPTLFKIFIDDIDAETVFLSSKFADDTKSAQVVRTEEDRDRYQKEGEKFEEWADTWGMTFNADKCKVMHVGRNNQKLPYTMSGQKMKITELEKDLGVLISEDMKPSQHCAKAAKSANATLGQISRAFHYRNKQMLAKLFKVFVRPKLEYAAQAWSPWLEKDCELLENVQKRCIKMMTDVQGETCEKAQRCGVAVVAGEKTER